MKLLSFILLILVANTLLAQTNNCKAIHDGIFKTIHPDGSETIIERYGNKQIETNPKIKKPLKFKVKWIDDCNYTLEMRKNLQYFKSPKQIRNLVVYAQITDIRPKYYSITARSNLDKREMQLKIYRISSL